MVTLPPSYTPVQKALIDRVAAETLRVRMHGAGRGTVYRNLLALIAEAIEAGLALKTLPLIQATLDEGSVTPDLLTLKGYALRDEQNLEDALLALEFASGLSKGNRQTEFAVAQTRFELGEPAASLFHKLIRAPAPAPDLLRNAAFAHAAEGQFDYARRILLRALGRSPEWIDGHNALATLDWTLGRQDEAGASFAAAVETAPSNIGLWMAWLRQKTLAKDWTAARDILVRAEAAVGDSYAMRAAALFLACESDDTTRAEAMIEATRDLSGDTVSLCRIRYALRQGDPARAETEALALARSSAGTMFWPYLSLAWRQMGDARAQWLDRPDDFICSFDLDFAPGEFDALADCLRTLHTARAPYIEQSVRGGTQTDRSVLLRHEAPLRAVRAKLMEAVRTYVAALPPHEDGHPLLGTPRAHLLIEGSWSVRLAGAGFNVAHTHPNGWLSSAFYVALPGPGDMGQAPAGHLAFGLAPPDLRLDLPAYKHIAPKPGRLALFPSTMWHSTIPFDQGERLNIAFDIRRPNY